MATGTIATAASPLSASDGNVPQPPRTLTLPRGLLRAQALEAFLTPWNKVVVYASVFLVAAAYSLDGVLRYAYQPYATASFSQHSLLATINVLRSIIATVAQPTTGKLADIFGRFELVCISVLFYVVGTIIEATSANISAFAAGAVFYQIGFTMMVLLLFLIVGDISSTRVRILASYVSSIPFLIIYWTSGRITDAVLGSIGWEWGLGMWAAIYFGCALPLIISMFYFTRRARGQETRPEQDPPEEVDGKPWSDWLMSLFQSLDIFGIVLMMISLGLLLVPLTIAGGFNTENLWTTPGILVPFILGFVSFGIFIWWELYHTDSPLIPFRLVLGDRKIWAPLGIAMILNWAWNLQNNYLLTVLRGAFDFTIAEATNISGLYTFCSILSGIIVGLIVFGLRRVKYFIVFGTCLFVVAFGLLIHFRGKPNGSTRSGIIGAQILLGIAGGLVPYPVLALLQANLKHEHFASITALYLTTYNIGGAFGNAIAGSVWTQLLPDDLTKNFDRFTNGTTLVNYAYESPFSFMDEYPIATPERDALIDSYRHVQWVLCIIGVCLCGLLVVAACFLPDLKLNRNRTLATETPPTIAGSTPPTTR
jgi:MFS transporter, SIT family, siderophore-iron:H+ symporter